ncbi:unnamed protein product [Amoebophrya sp. A120]|nr:unnamed protein product [Amoebophrya sp. A120]|eukprot:GSA120T00009447001.1
MFSGGVHHSPVRPRAKTQWGRDWTKVGYQQNLGTNLSSVQKSAVPTKQHHHHATTAMKQATKKTGGASAAAAVPAPPRVIGATLPMLVNNNHGMPKLKPYQTIVVQPLTGKKIVLDSRTMQPIADLTTTESGKVKMVPIRADHVVDKENQKPSQQQAVVSKMNNGTTRNPHTHLSPATTAHLSPGDHSP